MGSDAVASVSVDLDPLQHYFRIHGLAVPALSPQLRALAHVAAVERFGELLASLGLTGTLFAIGEELGEPPPRAALRAAVQAGHEVASHSHRHAYTLSRQPPAELDLELAEAERAIEAATGERPVGFRAPGYALSEALVAALAARGYRYDSSVFPAAPYYLAKATVMALLAARGHRSGAMLDTPRVLLAPRHPYALDSRAPYRAGPPGGLLELPISTSRVGRVPLLGTWVVSLPTAASRALLGLFAGELFLNLELHAVDFLGPGDGLPEALVARQRELSVPVATKLARLSAVLGWVRDRFAVHPLREVARRLHEQGVGQKTRGRAWGTGA